MALDLLIAAAFYRGGTAPILGSMAWIKSLSGAPPLNAILPAQGGKK